MPKQNINELLSLPFLDAKSIMQIFGNVIKKDAVYATMHALLEEKDEDGNLLIDPNRMPKTRKMIIPTSVFCKKYKIKRPSGHC